LEDLSEDEINELELEFQRSINTSKQKHKEGREEVTGFVSMHMLGADNLLTVSGSFIILKTDLVM
jgi:hypothetical protein